jgi:hypothetical protein
MEKEKFKKAGLDALRGVWSYLRFAMGVFIAIFIGLVSRRKGYTYLLEVCKDYFVNEYTNLYNKVKDVSQMENGSKAGKNGDKE